MKNQMKAIPQAVMTDLGGRAHGLLFIVTPCAITDPMTNKHIAPSPYPVMQMLLNLIDREIHTVRE